MLTQLPYFYLLTQLPYFYSGTHLPGNRFAYLRISLERLDSVSVLFLSVWGWREREGEGEGRRGEESLDTKGNGEMNLELSTMCIG